MSNYIYSINYETKNVLFKIEPQEIYKIATCSLHLENDPDVILVKNEITKYNFVTKKNLKTIADKILIESKKLANQ